jgi:hypothetical protein
MANESAPGRLPFVVMVNGQPRNIDAYQHELLARSASPDPAEREAAIASVAALKVLIGKCAAAAEEAEHSGPPETMRRRMRKALRRAGVWGQIVLEPNEAADAGD